MSSAGLEKPARAGGASMVPRAANWGPSDPFPRVISMPCEVKLKVPEIVRFQAGT
jgi:hypothetical protein